VTTVTFDGIADDVVVGDAEVASPLVAEVEQAAAPKATTAVMVNVRMMCMRFLP